jgi:hypothetical protein
MSFFLSPPPPDVPASAAYFGSYEIIQRSMVPEGGDRSQISLGRTIFAGGMAGIFNWMVAIPADVLKSRLQTGELHTILKTIYCFSQKNVKLSLHTYLFNNFNNYNNQQKYIPNFKNILSRILIPRFLQNNYILIFYHCAHNSRIKVYWAQPLRSCKRETKSFIHTLAA